jgi:hypothetical protein
MLGSLRIRCLHLLWRRGQPLLFFLLISKVVLVLKIFRVINQSCYRNFVSQMPAPSVETRTALSTSFWSVQPLSDLVLPCSR